MEEDIKILENTGIIELKDGLSYDKAIEYRFAVDKLLNELERLQKDNEALEHQLKRLHTENSNITRELLSRTNKLNELLINSIPKQKLTEIIEKHKTMVGYTYYDVYKVLKELLGGINNERE